MNAGVSLWYFFPARFSLAALALVVLATRSAQSEVIIVPFEALVTQVVGAPFGIVAQAGVTRVTGSFAYDTTVMPFEDSVINNSVFPAKIDTGFVMHVGGVTITSSDYLLDAINDVTNFGGSDIFRASADPDGLNSMGGDFRVNGVPARGSADMELIDIDQTFYATNADVDVLPTLAQLAQVDFQWGFLGDEMGSGGPNASYLLFQTVPEPSGVLLALESFLVGLALSRRHAGTRA
jgi:hypothetical protein